MPTIGTGKHFLLWLALSQNQYFQLPTDFCLITSQIRGTHPCLSKNKEGAPPSKSAPGTAKRHPKSPYSTNLLNQVALCSISSKSSLVHDIVTHAPPDECSYKLTCKTLWTVPSFGTLAHVPCLMYTIHA